MWKKQGSWNFFHAKLIPNSSNNDKYYCSELIYDIYKDQFGIQLATPKPIKSYHIFGLGKLMKRRGMDPNQKVVAPCDLL